LLGVDKVVAPPIPHQVHEQVKHKEQLAKLPKSLQPGKTT
jgi:hypothetical protein